MKLLDITGGIGSGKSVVCKILSELNIPVYYADDEAKKLMHHSSALKQRIIDAFGKNAYIGGELNKAFLRKEVFNDSNQIKRLNSIVHPAVDRHFREWLKKHSNHSAVARETALITEKRSYEDISAHFLIAVTAPEDLKIERILQRDKNRDIAEIKNIIKKQPSEKEFQAQADFILRNDNSQLLTPKILDVLNR